MHFHALHRLLDERTFWGGSISTHYVMRHAKTRLANCCTKKQMPAQGHNLLTYIICWALTLIMKPMVSWTWAIPKAMSWFIIGTIKHVLVSTVK